MRLLLMSFLLAAGLAGCRKEVIVMTGLPSRPSGRGSGILMPSFKINNVTDRYQYHHPFGGNSGVFWFLDIEKKPDSTVPLSLEIVHFNRIFNASTTEYSNGTWTMAIYDSGVANGIYDFTVQARTGSQSVVSYPFKVIVEGNLSCTGYLTDLFFDAVGYLPAVTYYPNMRFQKSLPESDTLLLANFKGNKTLQVIPDCSTESFLVPSQKIGDTTYKGTGSIIYDQQLRTTKIELHILEESGMWAYIVDYIMKSK